MVQSPCPRGQAPLSLDNGGLLSVYLRIRRQRNWKSQAEETRLVEYSLAFSGLAEADGRIGSLRYDLDPGNATPRSREWNEELQDNIAHPTFHLHVNSHVSERANDVRLALGAVSPILVLRNFGSWYTKAK
jgi:hypothetical protein